jgi:hypothetical protein
MDRKPTVKQILIAWLTSMIDTSPEFMSHNIETDVVGYGKSQGVLHSPGTYSRAFRDYKADAETMRRTGIIVKPVGTTGTESKWKVERFAV